MPISPTDPPAPSDTLLRFAGGRAELRVEGGGGGAALAVPGTEVTIHWLALAGDLAPAQAAAAARLMLADASAAPLADMHVVAGRPEVGLTPVAIVPAAMMAAWLADDFDPDLVLPETALLLPPAEGLVRRRLDHRGLAAAFSAEPELAALIAGHVAVNEIGGDTFKAGLAGALAAPLVNLRQGVFAKRRRFVIETGSVRRVALLVAALLLVSLILQFATILRYSFDADRMEREAAAIGPAAGARANFDRLTPVLFEAVRSTPNAAVSRLDYRPDGSLAAIVVVDSQTTLAALRARAEAAGTISSGGPLVTSAGGASAEIVLRPA